MELIPAKHEGAVPIKSWAVGVPFEDQARTQVERVASLGSFVGPHVAVMPDVHWGIGATVGSVIPTFGAVIPAAVGVDIGCGMMALRLNLKAKDLPDNLAQLRSAIEAVVPHGRSHNGGENDVGAHRSPSIYLGALWEGAYGFDLQARYEKIVDKHPRVSHRAALRQLGTLGTGNHFIEVCLDEAGDVWVMLHSGSRGPGNAIGTYFIEQARQEMARLDVHLPDRDLAYLSEGSTLFQDYLEAVGWAQDYAMLNRETMMNATVQAIRRTLRVKVKADEVAVQCHHNYVAQEEHFGRRLWITRKGAVHAGQGVLGIIPGSMGTRSYIVRGKGNPESFCSCSHGAGRAMSRAKAKELFTLKDHREATEGVECRKDKDVIDETPKAYKGIDEVMAAQTDLVEVVHTLKQVLCVKG